MRQTSRPRKPSARRTLIVDRRSLSVIVAEMIRALGDGNDFAAARRVGVSRSTIHRLRSGAKAFVSQGVAEALARAAEILGPRWARYLRLCFVGDLALEILEVYASWCRDRPRHWAGLRSPVWQGMAVDKPTRAKGDQVAPTREWQRYELERFCLGPELYSRLYRGQPPHTAHHLGDFNEWGRKHGVEDARLLAAAARILEPLLESADAAFVDPSWFELTPAELARFLRLGAEREKILLRRRGRLADRVRALAAKK